MMKYLFQALRWFLITIAYVTAQFFLVLWHFDFQHCHNYLSFVNTAIERLEEDNDDDGWGY